MRNTVMMGGSFGLLGVALGAFGAHALKDRIGPAMLDVYKTGVQYQLVHALALLFLALLADRRRDSRYLPWCARLFAAGIVLFSGSLYLLAITGVRFLGIITPLGGLCFLSGWSLLILGMSREPEA